MRQCEVDVPLVGLMEDFCLNRGLLCVLHEVSILELARKEKVSKDVRELNATTAIVMAARTKEEI